MSHARWVAGAVVALVAASASVAGARPLRAVAVGFDSTICAIDGRGQVVCTDARELPAAGVTAVDLALAGWNVLVDARGRLWRWQQAYDGSPPTMIAVPVPFAVRRVGHVDGGEVCALGRKGELACGDVTDALKPVEVGVRFASIAFAPYDTWLVDRRGGLWCRGRGACAELRAAMASDEPIALDDPSVAMRYPGPLAQLKAIGLTHVADGVARLRANGYVCAELVATPGRGMCWGWNTPPQAEDLRSDEVVAVGSRLCHRQRARFTCRYPAAQADILTGPPVVTFDVPGAAGSYQQFGSLCVDVGGTLACADHTRALAGDPFTPLPWAQRPASP